MHLSLSLFMTCCSTKYYFAWKKHHKNARALQTNVLLFFQYFAEGPLLIIDFVVLLLHAIQRCVVIKMKNSVFITHQ